MGLFRHASIGFKVALAPVVAVLCLSIVTVLGLTATRELSISLRDLQSTTLPNVATATDLQRRIGAACATANQSLAWTGAGFPDARIAEIDKNLIAELDAIEKRIADQQALSIWNESELQKLGEIAAAYAKFKRSVLDTLDMKGSGLVNANAFIASMQAEFRNVDAQISALTVSQYSAAGGRVDASAEAARRKGVVIATGAAIGFLLSAIAAWWCRSMIVAPLRSAQRIAGAVARGDLRMRSADASKDETGRMLKALDEVSGQLGEIVVEVRSTAQQVEMASKEIAQGNADLSTRTETQATKLQQMIESTLQLTASVERNARNAKDADTLGREAQKVTEDGGKAVEEVVCTMDQLNAQSQRISEIIGVIDGIAFQTNILALNAAVEAARAGEQGRGFAVVASEVRTLAQRSAGAAKEIRGLIGTSVEHTKAGADKVQAAGEAMMKIVDVIARTASVITQIAAATHEQSIDVKQIDRAVADMDRSTQQNAALVEQASAATESLKGQSIRLVQLLGRFQTAEAV